MIERWDEGGPPDPRLDAYEITYDYMPVTIDRSILDGLSEIRVEPGSVARVPIWGGTESLRNPRRQGFIGSDWLEPVPETPAQERSRRADEYYRKVYGGTHNVATFSSVMKEVWDSQTLLNQMYNEQIMFKNQTLEPGSLVPYTPMQITKLKRIKRAARIWVSDVRRGWRAYRGDEDMWD